MVFFARHIGIEATRLLRERRGIGRYVHNILRWIPRHRDDVRFTLFVSNASEDGAVRTLLDTIDPTLAARTTVADIAALPHTDADVVWYPWNWLHPRARQAAMVVSILDVAPMLQLDGRWWKVLKRARFRRRFVSSLRDADLVLTISEFSARELVHHLRADRARIRVTLLAADDKQHSERGQSAALVRLGITGPFFLTVGAHDKRKNLSTLYRAMELLHAAGDTVPLVQAGPHRATGAPASVVYAGYVDDAELATLYQLATALVFPSRYEGFGLPVVEAMSAGGRVICADASSLPEVVGAAGLLFPWNDARALALHMTTLLHDDVLQARLTRDGLQQSRRFTWSATARQTLDAFDESMTLRSRRRE